MIIAGNIVTDEGMQQRRITFDDNGIISAVASEPDSSSLTLAGLVFPGFIDIHVHAREYPLPESATADDRQRQHAQTAKETYATAARAALNGGITAFAEMPNNPLPPSTAAIYQRKLRLASAAPLPVLPFAAITADSEPFAAVPYKLYLDDPAGPCQFADMRQAETTLARYRGQSVAFHCEDPDVIRRHAHLDGAAARPAAAEAAAIAKVLEWTERFSLRTHICHLSTRCGMELTADYNRGREAPRRVTTEATPHHLAFSLTTAAIVADDFPLEQYPQRELLFMKPPLRTEDDRRYLLDCLRSGSIDCLATDHAPHTLADKAAGAAGLPLLDHYASFACWLMQRQRFTPQDIMRCCAQRPGDFINRFSAVPQGRIAVGYKASFTVIDPASQVPRRLFTKCSWSPFPPGLLQGAASETIVAGKSWSAEHAAESDLA